MITNDNNCIGYLIYGNCIEYGLIIDGNIQFSPNFIQKCQINRQKS